MLRSPSVLRGVAIALCSSQCAVSSTSSSSPSTVLFRRNNTPFTSSPSSCSSSSCASAAASHTNNNQVRHMQFQPSAVRGTITPYRGFVTTDIKIDDNVQIGGQYGRGVYARSNIGFGREIMNIAPIASYIGDEPIRDQAMIVATDLFSVMVNHEKNPAAEAFIQTRVMTLMNGGQAFFLRERDVTTFIDRVPGGSLYMEMGKVTVMQLQKLPQQIEYNRWEVEYRGRKGICLFPEASYFNHQCSPNVEITIMHDSIKGFTLSAVTTRPIKAGEELFISYLPDNDLPLSRLQLALRKRWGFDCSCIVCRSRSTASYVLGLGFVLIPGILWLRAYHQRHQENKMRRATGT